MDDSLDVSSTVERVKDVLYLDGDDDDVLLSSYVRAAFSFVHSAIGEDVNGFYEDSNVDSLVMMSVVSLAATYFQNRLSLYVLIRCISIIGHHLMVCLYKLR